MDNSQSNHQRIVAQWREHCGGLWPLLAGDDDVRQHLAEHLAGAGLWEELVALTTGSDAWAKARLAAEGNYDGYLADLELVRRRAASLPGGGWGIRVRCALLQSSVSSPEAEDYGGDMDMRAQAFSALAHFLPGQLKVEALRAMLGTLCTMWNQLDAAEDLGWMVERGDLPDELVDEALAVARGFTDHGPRAEALSALLPRLPYELRAQVEREALDAALAEGFEASRGCALEELAKTLPAELQGQLLAGAGTITDAMMRAETLQNLAPYLTDDLRVQALAMARGIADAFARAQVLAALAGCLPDELASQVAGEALAAAHQEESEQLRLSALEDLVRVLPQHLKTPAAREALVALRAIEKDDDRARTMCALAEYLPYGMYGEALAITREFQDEGARALALSTLAEHLPAELQDEALAIGRGLQGDSARMQALSNLLEHLPDDLRGQVAPEVLGLAGRLGDEQIPFLVVRDLAQYLPDELKVEAQALAGRLLRETEEETASIGAVDYPPDSTEARILAEEGGAASSLFMMETSRWDRLADLADDLPRLQETVYSALLRSMAKGPRHQLVYLLKGHLRLLERLGGVDALTDLLHALVDTAAWWPSPKSRFDGARNAEPAGEPSA